MKNITILVLLIIALPWGVDAAAADSQRGGRLFASPELGGGTSGKTCLTCHEGARDFEPATMTRERYEVMDIPMANLPEVINFCIEVTLRGEGLDPQGRDMSDLIAYLRIFIAQHQPVK